MVPEEPKPGAPAEPERRWYADGLRFECTGCGRCCTGRDAYVWTSVEEILAIAAHLGLEPNEFGRRYLRRVGGRYALLDRPGGDCVFLAGTLCSVHDVRPAQCRAFPWWPANLESPRAWERAARGCEGISDVAPTVVADVIERALESAVAAGLCTGRADDGSSGSPERSARTDPERDR